MEDITFYSSKYLCHNGILIGFTEGTIILF